MPRVASLSGTRSTTTSQSRKKSSSGRSWAERDHPTVANPCPAHVERTVLPIAPAPRTPTVNSRAKIGVRFTPPGRRRLHCGVAVEVALEVNDPTEDVERDVVGHRRINQAHDRDIRQAAEVEMVVARTQHEDRLEVGVRHQPLSRKSPHRHVGDGVRVDLGGDMTHVEVGECRSEVRDPRAVIDSLDHHHAHLGYQLGANFAASDARRYARSAPPAVLSSRSVVRRDAKYRTHGRVTACRETQRRFQDGRPSEESCREPADLAVCLDFFGNDDGIPLQRRRVASGQRLVQHVGGKTAAHQRCIDAIATERIGRPRCITHDQRTWAPSSGRPTRRWATGDASGV